VWAFEKIQAMAVCLARISYAIKKTLWIIFGILIK